MKLPNGQTAFAGVLGWPVNHSLSPFIHNRWLEQNAVNALYLPFPVQPDALGTVLLALPKMGCAGVNLTIPHKEAALDLLDGVDETARRIGAVNTVVMRDGKTYGHNTDAYGFITSLKAADYCKDNALVIGAGGAARAVVTALLQDGFACVTVMNRTREKAEALKSLGRAVEVVDWQPVLPHADVVVNVTSLGMHGQPELSVDMKHLPPHAVVADIVYAPLETPLLVQAKAQGFKAIDGLGMLLFQAQAAFSLWFGINPEVTDELRQQVLKQREGV